jgi:predicted nucleotidyltransferase
VLDKRTIDSTVKRYTEAVTKELSPAAVVLYGSHAKGNAREDSDIDVAVIFDGFQGDWLETSSSLWRLRRGISYDIEPILLDSQNDKSGFVANVCKTGRVSYQA